MSDPSPTDAATPPQGEAPPSPPAPPPEQLPTVPPSAGAGGGAEASAENSAAAASPELSIDLDAPEAPPRIDEGALPAERCIVTMERYEAARLSIEAALRNAFHPAKAAVTDIEAMEWLAQAIRDVAAGGRLPPKPNRPPVAQPGRSRGWKPRA